MFLHDFLGESASQQPLVPRIDGNSNYHGDPSMIPSKMIPGMFLPEPRSTVKQLPPRRERPGYDLVPCQGCKGDVRIKVPVPPSPSVAHLHSIAQAKPSEVKPLTWAYGVTTVPERRTNGLLLGSLASLRTAGFDQPRLFVDGEPERFSDLGLPVTFHVPRVRTVGNWLLAAMELLIRNPQADRYAIFQDDIVCVGNLRKYLEAVPYPDHGYCNLFTFRENENVIRERSGWVVAHSLNGKPGWQKGLSALGLVFSREALTVLLQSPHIQRKVMDTSLDTVGMPNGQPRLFSDGAPRFKGNSRVDGMIVTAMNMAGWNECVHAPSLLDHIGNNKSTMGNGGNHNARTFRGEKFDALSLLK